MMDENTDRICLLLDQMVMDIMMLEEELVRTRLELYQLLPEGEKSIYRCEILPNLAGRYYDHPLYQEYMELLHDGQDPMESEDHLSILWTLFDLPEEP